MRAFITASLLVLLLASCKSKDRKPSDGEMLSELISSNKEITSYLTEAFAIEDTSDAKVFKLLISRRDRFVRFTIYQIINRSSLDVVPKGYFYYNKNLFLFFDGSEIIFNEKIKEKELDSLLSNIKLLNNDYSFFDSPVVQFDIDANKKITFNFPPINPYDLTEVPADSRWQTEGKRK